jgi:hypothetical protein
VLPSRLILFNLTFSLKEKTCAKEKLHLGMIYSAVAMCSTSMNQQQIYNKISLKDTHKENIVH